jgi:hypothetical protein
MKLNNLKPVIVASALLCFTLKISAQIGIGVSGSVNSSAALEVTSSTKGFLPPRMTTSQRDAISSPENGLIIYNSTTGKLNIRENGNWSELSATNRDQTISGNNTFSGNNSFSGNLTVAGNTTLSGNLTLAGSATLNGATTVNGEVTMNSRLVIPMAQLSFYNSSGVTTSTSATAWNSTTSSTNWTSIVWPSRGSTIGTNTLVDSISTLGARINHNNSGNGAGVIAYKGSSTKMFNITYSINFKGSSTNGSKFDEFVFGIFKNNVLIPGSVFVTDNTNAEERVVTIQAITSMSANDWVNLRVIGKTGSQSVDVYIYGATMTAFGL